MILLRPKNGDAQDPSVAIALSNTNWKHTQTSIKTRFITAADLVFQLEKAQQQGRIDRFMRRSLLGPGILIIDEVGYLPLLVSCIKLTVDMRAFDAHAPLLSKSPQHFLSIRTVFYLRYVFR